jgi:hypothetical protein
MTESERLFKTYVDTTGDEITSMELFPPGDEVFTADTPTNIVVIQLADREVMFGGVREDFFNKMNKLLFNI